MMTMTQPQIAPSLFGTIKAAVACDDIHQACQIVQKLLGVCHGGLSGIHFPELGDAPAPHGAPWCKVGASDRFDRMVGYIKAEIDVMDRTFGGETLSIRGFRQLRTGTDSIVLAHRFPQGSVWRITADDGASIPRPGDRVRVDHLDVDGETVLFAAEYDWSSFSPNALMARVAATYGALTFG
jgi:hypothetical protein